MLRRLSAYVKHNAVAFVALFIAMGGTGAYAANTIRSTDIVDGEVASVDIKNQDIASADVKDQSLTTFDVSTFLGADVVDGTLTGDDIASESIDGIDIIDGKIGGNDVDDGTIGSVDIADNTLTGADVADNTLGGNDIVESSLNLPNAATFAVSGARTNPNGFDNQFVRIAFKSLPPGWWAVVATATTDELNPRFDGADIVSNVQCELRDPVGNVIGGTTDRRLIRYQGQTIRSLTSTGGAGVPAGGGVVSLWCRSDQTQASVNAVMTFIQVDRFL